MNEESTTRASISRIVMLAEALFEVLIFPGRVLFSLDNNICILFKYSCSCIFEKVLAEVLPEVCVILCFMFYKKIEFHIS